MYFANLDAGQLFWFLFLLAVFYLWTVKVRKRTASKFASLELLNLLSSSSERRQVLKGSLMLLAAALCILAMMRPQYGFHWEEIKRRGLDIIIAVDTSKSMLAEDVKPNRLERAKMAVKDLLKKIRGDRVGLVAFAGEAFLQCPLTLDYNGFLLSLNSLDSDIIPEPGTSIHDAIKESLRSYEAGSKGSRVLIIITDGEDHLGEVQKAAEEAKKEGVVIFTVGVGTAEGELVPDSVEKGFLKDKSGNFVKSRLQEEMLEKVAVITGGSYVRFSGVGSGLEGIYDSRISVMQKDDFKGKMQKRYVERFGFFLLAAVFLLIGESFIGERRKE